MNKSFHILLYINKVREVIYPALSKHKGNPEGHGPNSDLRTTKGKLKRQT